MRRTSCKRWAGSGYYNGRRFSWDVFVPRVVLNKPALSLLHPAIAPLYLPTMWIMNYHYHTFMSLSLNSPTYGSLGEYRMVGSTLKYKLPIPHTHRYLLGTG